MNVPQPLAETVASYRTLVVEGHEGIHRTQLFTQLALLGFPLRRPPGGLHHLDPTRPYRELLAAPGRFVIDGGIIGELVYGPLRHGRSRVTWIQALDLAEAVAEREGALLHLTGNEYSGDSGDDGSETAAAALAYTRAVRTLAQHVPVVSVNIAPRRAGRGRRADPPHPRTRTPAVQLRQLTSQLTVG